jgi:DNA-binding CsgD family transcriptional regulator
MTLADFRLTVLDAVRTMIPAEYVSYNELAAGVPVATIADPELPEWAHEAWDRHGHTNPLIVNAIERRDLRPYRWSDVVDLRRFRRTPLFEEIYGPLGIDHQIAFELPSPPQLMIGVALSRKGDDFTNADREMLDLARPHLIQAYRSAQLRDELQRMVAAAHTAVDASGVGLAVVDGGTVRFATEFARAATAEAGLGGLAEGEPVPPALIAAERPRLLRLEGDTAFLRVLDDEGDGQTVLIFERARSVFSGDALSGLGLTPREADVLAGFAEGLDTGEVAAKHGISAATVHKHARSIHAKLAVTSRAQAVATAWAAAGAALPMDG